MWSVIAELQTECGFRSRDRRSAIVCAEAFQLAPLSKAKVLVAAETELERVLGKGAAFGWYWLPLDKYVLGHDAGRMIGAFLLGNPEAIDHKARVLKHSVAEEIAKILRQRFQGKFRELMDSGDRAAFDAIVAGAGSTTCIRGRCKTLLFLDRSRHA